MTPRAAVVCLALASACGTANTAGPPAKKPAPMAHGQGKEMDIRKAALPFRVLRGEGGTEVSEADFVAALTGADAICLGESHDNPHHHWLQLELLERVVRARGEREVAVGFEMFQRPFQGVVDDYSAGRIDEPALLARTAWEERWGYPFAFYRPMVELARGEKLPILALNAPAELARKIGRGGVDALAPDEKKALPELDLTDAEHRAWFKAATEGHGGPADDFERFYSAQVLWDETMAETAARWLGGKPRRQIVILAGHGHCHRAAVPRRLARRGIRQIVSVQPVIDDGAGAVADLLAAPENDFVVVLEVGSGTSPHTSHAK